ncbi:ATP-grasp domain-containing protein [Bythopirellula polymerisocia]|uniref:ATP-grasp domain protein n=1 Tax=Bythopirellula polymerisocia TaxID=2528003 RepID=A0A5C6D4C0_9BACT|nr:ATP-grasp domain-containing protein [Bythopirellula polymerisocia]TWU30096.1 ATP-grasp domain protein [Bythopirellula polymerisocia]
MTTRPTIAVVGASARAAAFSLLRAGFQAVTADLFADADLRRACPAERVTNYPHDLADYLARTECDGWIYTGALENYPDLVDQMAAMRPLRGNSGSVLRAIRNLLLLQATLKDVGLDFPETFACSGQSPGAGDWLHKTGLGASGSGVCEFDSLNLPTEGYWQRRISGVSCSAIYLASSQTCKLLGITRQLVGEQWTGARQFQYCGTIAPWELPSQAVAQLHRIGDVVSKEFELRDLFGVDFVFDGKVVWPVEVNPRTTAAVEAVERATESQLLCGKAILYAKYPLAISPTSSDRLLHRCGTLEHPRLADIPNAHAEVAPGEPMLTVLVDGVSVADVESKLRQQVAKLEIELYGCMTQ